MATDDVFEKLKNVKAEQLIELAELAESKQFLIGLRNAIILATSWVFKNNSENRQKLLANFNKIGQDFCGEVDTMIGETDSVFASLLKEGYLEGRLEEVMKLKDAIMELARLKEQESDEPTTEPNPPVNI